MKIGILSDSHGHVDRLACAVEALVSHGASVLVHCGDIVSPESVELLARSGLDSYVVVGNMDRHADRLRQAAEREGVHFAWEVIEVPLGDSDHLVAAHGHDYAVLEELIAGQQFPYICHGHSHVRRDERIGKVRVINPGALHHPRDHDASAALLDTESDSLEFVLFE